MSCWPSTTSTPARCSANRTSGSTASTPTGSSSRPRCSSSARIFSATLSARPDSGDMAPRSVVMPGRRAEVPHDRLVALREQAEAVELVRRPGADVGSGDVADVSHVEAQQRSERRVGEQRLDAREALVAEAIEADALLPVDPHRAVAVDSHHDLRSPRLLQSFAGYHAVAGATNLRGA